MSPNDIATYRLVNQQLAGTKITTPKDMVRHFGAMQAQDYAMTKWAVGIRLAATESAIEQAIGDGAIIRTHVLRPTWHLVAAEDIRWMLALTGPHVKRLLTSTANSLGLDEKTLKRFNTIIARELRGKHLTRAELMNLLKVKGATPNDMRPGIVLMNAELEGVVGNGAMRGKQFTYALLDERVPESKILTKEESLAKLAKTYFTSHGPATIKDFAWWSGLSVVSSKLALELIKPDLNLVEMEGQGYWFYGAPPAKAKHDNIHFLPAFDEFLISYKDRTASIPLDHQPRAFTRNGIFKPVIVLNGVVVGTWKRTHRKEAVVIEADFFKPLKKGAVRAFQDEAMRYGTYMNKEVIISL